jgi:hypothetical protein
MWRFDYFDGSHDEITQSSYGLHAECVDGVTGSVLAYTFNTRGLRYKNVAQCEYAKPDSNDILGSSMFWGRLADGIFRKFYTPNVAVIDWEFSADDEIATKGYVNTATGNSPALKQLGEKVAEIQKQLPKKEVGAFENPNTYTGLYEAFADVDETTRFVFRWTSALNPPLSLTITNTKFTSGISKHFFVNGTIVDADGVVSSLNFDAFLNATAHYVYRFPALKTENIGLIKIDAVVGSFSTGELYKILCIYMNNGTERNVTISAEKI